MFGLWILDRASILWWGLSISSVLGPILAHLPPRLPAKHAVYLACRWLPSLYRQQVLPCVCVCFKRGQQSTRI